MLVNSTGLLRRARREGRCVPAFNIYNLETAQAALEASRLAGRPVILAFGAGYLENASLEVVHAIADTLARRHPRPVALHLDHCRDLALIEEALRAGFTSVMYDGSRLPLGENIANTREAARMAHAADAGLEGELGCLNAEDGTGTASSPYTDPGEARRYAAESGADALAVAVGNAHGLYRGTPHLDMARLAELRDAAGLPLVLHGCSGIPGEQVRRAVSIAVAKINVNTEAALAGAQAAGDLLRRGEGVRYEKLTLAARARMAEAMGRFYTFCEPAV